MEPEEAGHQSKGWAARQLPAHVSRQPTGVVHFLCDAAGARPGRSLLQDLFQSLKLEAAATPRLGCVWPERSPVVQVLASDIGLAKTHSTGGRAAGDLRRHLQRAVVHNRARVTPTRRR